MIQTAIASSKEWTLYPEDDDRYVPELALTGVLDTEVCKAYLQGCDRHIETLLTKNVQQDSLLRIRTRMIDRLIQALFNQAETIASEKFPQMRGKTALLAQGGYGRGEMCLHSDIDLLLLLPEGKKTDYATLLTERMLYPLWDLGLDVGHAARSITDCKKAFFEDVTIMTALLEVRHLAGPVELTDKLKADLWKARRSGLVQKKLIRLKMEEWKARLEKMGGSAFMLEPHVRDSVGGLRDLQYPVWIARIQGDDDTYEALRDNGLLREEEYAFVIHARRFLWRVRNELHLLSGKKDDILGFGRQVTVSERLGYQPTPGILAVEKFMQDYYRLTSQVAEITDVIARRMNYRKKSFRLLERMKSRSLDAQFKNLDDQVAVKKGNIFEKDPVNLLRLFKWVKDTGFPLHPDTKDLVRDCLSLVNQELRDNPEAISIFRKMLGDYKNLGHAFMEMHEAHFLEEWLPEFKKVVCRVQHDAYHVYTVDTHSIFALNELSRLHEGFYGEKFATYRKVLSEVIDPEVMNLGLFLHDIGKGEGGSHSVKGAVIANGLTKRLGMSEEAQRTVEFLILSHLMMPHLSQRRDLEDQELIIQFAKSMGTVDRLSMLFLLTWGDIRAVGPKTWTDWKGTLLLRLYEKTRDTIERGEFSKEKTNERITRLRESLLSKLANRFDRDEATRFLNILPPRYFFAGHDEDIDAHFEIYKRSLAELVVVTQHCYPDRNLNEILIYAPNHPRVLPDVTGVMLAYSINILSVDLFQTTDGHILLALSVTDAAGDAMPEWRKFDDLSLALKEVLFRRARVEELLEKRKIPDYLVKKPIQKIQSKVEIDNDVSAYYTVIEVYAHDRLGLLYEIMTVLNELGCYVEVSKISTKVDQVSDVFYVKDIFGKKIDSRTKTAQIKESLMAVAEGWPRGE